MQIKSIEDIMKEQGDNVYLWKDDETLDVLIKDTGKNFIEELLNFDCLKCGGKIIDGNEVFLRDFTESVSGIQILCNNCKQKLFVHRKVRFY